MSNLRQAAQRALKAMEDGEWRADMVEFSDALIALRAALAEPQTTHWEGCEALHPECRKPEPVAWVEPKWLDPDTRGWPSDSFESVPIEGWFPLYTTPPQRKPLTDYINAAGINGGDSPHMVVEKLQSAIERAHGITGDSK